MSRTRSRSRTRKEEALQKVGWMDGGGAKIKKSHREWSASETEERDLEQFVPAGQMRGENRRLRSESVFEEREVRESERAS